MVSALPACVSGQRTSLDDAAVGVSVTARISNLINDVEIIPIVCVSMCSEFEHPLVDRPSRWCHPLVNDIEADGSLAFIDCRVT